MADGLVMVRWDECLERLALITSLSFRHPSL
jgi:hypothetical protein